MTLQKEGKDVHTWVFLSPHYTTGASTFHPSDFTYECGN